MSEILEGAIWQVCDESQSHRGHREVHDVSQEALTHVTVSIQSPFFIRMNVLERHRLVCDRLRDVFQFLHSVSLKLDVHEV